MAQEIMWSYTDGHYRGQATNGTLVTIQQEAMETALQKAGKSVFDSDWWVETLTVVLDRWGVFGKRWIDPATAMPRMHFTKGEPKIDVEVPKMQSGPLTTRILSKKKEEGE